MCNTIMLHCTFGQILNYMKVSIKSSHTKIYKPMHEHEAQSFLLDPNEETS